MSQIENFLGYPVSI